MKRAPHLEDFRFLFHWTVFLYVQWKKILELAALLDFRNLITCTSSQNFELESTFSLRYNHLEIANSYYSFCGFCIIYVVYVNADSSWRSRFLAIPFCNKKLNAIHLETTVKQMPEVKMKHWEIWERFVWHLNKYIFSCCQIYLQNWLSISGSSLGSSRRFLTDFLQEYPTPGTGPYFDTTIPSNITGLVGKTVHLVCKVKNLGNRTVSIAFFFNKMIICMGIHTLSV